MTQVRTRSTLFIAAVVLLVFAGCARTPTPFDELYPGDASAGDGDTDTDADNDTDADTDSDADGDADIPLPEGTVYGFQGTPTIDGSVSDIAWNLTEPVKRVIDGIGNNTVYFQALWDYNFLYVGVQVSDNLLKSDSSDPWHDDSVEIFVDGDNRKSTHYDSHDIEYIMAYQNHGIRITVDRPTNAVWGTNVINGGYVAEIAIPWSDLDIIPAPNTSVGLDIGINDDDDGADRDSHMMWSGDDDNWTDTSGFGTVILSELPAR